ncbi:MAG: aspartyl protease family protein [Acidobacteria bacterium]|nr:aspartyl protease family protein [Acidobacteriota bacterium]
MGVVSAKLGIANPLNPTRGTTVELLVDTGALYSVLPRRVLTELGIEPFERKVFKTADGRQIERAVGEAVFAFNSERGISKVVFGDERDASVLGVTALEELGLEVDPASRKLRPSTLFLYSSWHGFSRAEPASPFFLGFSP